MSKTTFVRLQTWLLVAVVLALLAACAPAPTAAPQATTSTGAVQQPQPTAVAKQPKPGGTLTIGTNQDALGFDPHLSNATASFRILENVYNGLLKVNAKLEVQPDLAESYTVDSPTQYTFHLRKGVKFHTGRELKAADVKYSIERIKNPANKPPPASTLATADSIDPPDD